MSQGGSERQEHHKLQSITSIRAQVAEVAEFTSMPGRYASAHANYAGAGDGRPMAEQIVKDEQLAGKLTGLTFLVTGGSGGAHCLQQHASLPTPPTYTCYRPR